MVCCREGFGVYTYLLAGKYFAVWVGLGIGGWVMLASNVLWKLGRGVVAFWSGAVEWVGRPHFFFLSFLLFLVKILKSRFLFFQTTALFFGRLYLFERRGMCFFPPTFSLLDFMLRLPSRVLRRRDFRAF